MTDAILGANFLTDYEATIDFKTRSFITRQSGETSRHSFSFDMRAKEGNGGEQVSNPDQNDRGLTTPRTIDSDPSTTCANVQGISVFRPELSELQGGPRSDIKKNEEATYLSGENFSASVDEKCEGALSKDEDRAQFSDDVYLNYELFYPDDGYCVASGSYVDCEGEMGHCKFQETSSDLIVEPENTSAIPVRDLKLKVNEASSLNQEQKDELFKLLLNFRSHFSKKPGRCNMFVYKFEVCSTEPLVGFSRPIPFAVRPAVRTQIQEMLKDGIIELSQSSYLNPWTIVMREGKSLRIYLDARHMNTYTT
jgi:hypothetical protein